MERFRRYGSYVIWTALVWVVAFLGWWTQKPENVYALEHIWNLGVVQTETEAGAWQLVLFGLINLFGALLLKLWFRSIRIEEDLQAMIVFGQVLDGEKLLRLRAERNRVLEDAQAAHDNAGRWKKGDKRKDKDKAARILAAIDRSLDLIGVKSHQPRTVRVEMPD